MRITSIREVEELRWILEQHFGEVPENIIIESEEVVNEGIMYSGMMKLPQFKSLTDLKCCGIRVAKQITEVETL